MLSKRVHFPRRSHCDMIGRMLRILLFLFWMASVTLIAAPTARAQNVESSSDSLVTVTTKDGETYVGVIAAEDQATITIRTTSGVVIQIPRNQISTMSWVQPSKPEALHWRRDPNYSRLLFAPTGRPLERGDGYFSDHYVFLVGVAGGLTDQIGALVGMSIVPGIGLDEQVFYVAPKIGYQFSETFAASLGTVFFNASDVSGGILWGISTFGRVEASLTAGVGLGYVKEEADSDYELSEDPIILIGGAVQISNSMSFISENWLITGLEPSEMPFSIALRFFGDRLSADFGFLLIGEVLQEGLPIPWLSISYNFGKISGVGLAE